MRKWPRNIMLEAKLRAAPSWDGWWGFMCSYNPAMFCTFGTRWYWSVEKPRCQKGKRWESRIIEKVLGKLSKQLIAKKFLIPLGNTTRNLRNEVCEGAHLLSSWILLLNQRKLKCERSGGTCHTYCVHCCFNLLLVLLFSLKKLRVQKGVQVLS